MSFEKAQTICLSDHMKNMVPFFLQGNRRVSEIEANVVLDCATDKSSRLSSRLDWMKVHVLCHIM